MQLYFYDILMQILTWSTDWHKKGNFASAQFIIWSTVAAQKILLLGMKIWPWKCNKFWFFNKNPDLSTNYRKVRIRIQNVWNSVEYGLVSMFSQIFVSTCAEFQMSFKSRLIFCRGARIFAVAPWLFCILRLHFQGQLLPSFQEVIGFFGDKKCSKLWIAFRFWLSKSAK